ncbi:helix-turn-helix transcriptional regulator [Aeromonas media]|jgi:prophage regulatory protein|uniref:helix-turn-helix transcriptional regulator n=1 Tax=Aeromonas media TaxID=651 RepID=UPI0011192BE6|nr:AlpA family transcriptional regulator [Aeromonas media]
MEAQTPPTPPQFRLIRMKEVIQKTGLSKSSIYDLIARDQLPRPVRLSPTGGRSVAFVESEIDTWIAERIAARHAE